MSPPFRLINPLMDISASEGFGRLVIYDAVMISASPLPSCGWLWSHLPLCYRSNGAHQYPLYDIGVPARLVQKPAFLTSRFAKVSNMLLDSAHSIYGERQSDQLPLLLCAPSVSERFQTSPGNGQFACMLHRRIYAKIGHFRTCNLEIVKRGFAPKRLQTNETIFISHFPFIFLDLLIIYINLVFIVLYSDLDMMPFL